MYKKANPVLSIILYVLAGILVIYTIWSAAYCINYLAEYFASGELTFAGNEYDIINFHISTYGTEFLFAVVLFVLGWMLQPQSEKKPEVEEEPVEEVIGGIAIEE